MPDSDDIRFVVTRSLDERGHYKWHKAKKVDEIGISVNCIRTLDSLSKVMGHEMVHLHERVVKTVSPHAQHNKAFMLFAAEVCTIHQWDEGIF